MATHPATNSVHPDRYHLTIPSDWFELDFGGTVLEQRLRRAVMARAGSDPLLRGRARRFINELEAVVRTARRRGVIYAAGMLEAFDDDVVSALMMVSVVHVPAGEGDVLSQLGRMQSNRRGAADGSWQKILAVDLPQTGPAGRVVGVEILAVNDRVKLPYATMHTAIPIPGTNGAVVVTGGSPNVRLTAELHDLFEAITSTFRFVATAEGTAKVLA
jgi:hypothetical protein